MHICIQNSCEIPHYFSNENLSSSISLTIVERFTVSENVSYFYAIMIAISDRERFKQIYRVDLKKDKYNTILFEKHLINIK